MINEKCLVPQASPARLILAAHLDRSLPGTIKKVRGDLCVG
jgi:hypothetical protein